MCFHVSSSVWGALSLPHVTVLKGSLPSRTVSSGKPSRVRPPSGASLCCRPAESLTREGGCRPCARVTVFPDWELCRTGRVRLRVSPCPRRSPRSASAVCTEGPARVARRCYRGRFCSCGDDALMARCPGQKLSQRRLEPCSFVFSASAPEDSWVRSFCLILMSAERETVIQKRKRRMIGTSAVPLGCLTPGAQQGRGKVPVTGNAASAFTVRKILLSAF